MLIFAANLAVVTSITNGYINCKCFHFYSPPSTHAPKRSPESGS
jgi:hypothetical protein